MLTMSCYVLNMYMIWVDLLFQMHHLDSHQVGLKLIYLSESCFGSPLKSHVTWFIYLAESLVVDFHHKKITFNLSYVLNSTTLTNHMCLSFKVSYNLLSIDMHIIFKLVFKLHVICLFTSIKYFFLIYTFKCFKHTCIELHF